MTEEQNPNSEPTETIANPGSVSQDFPIVGIGASAGGLAAFEAFFSALPSDTESGMAFVLVQHLAPDHKSILADLVKRYTRMHVYEVEDGMRVEPNCAYIIPPNRDMAFLNGALELLEPAEPRGLRLPIDFFFRSLAQDQHERAICIVLSGTGSDGTLGVRAVKGEGGMVMAQDPDNTEYDGMPRSAIATGLVDYVLKPADMPAQLIAYVNHAFGKKAQPLAAPTPKSEDLLKKLCVLLRAQTGHDFSQYKQNTLVRRVERRMAIQQIEHTGDYLRFAQKTPAELDALFRDLLIGVTNFFRDPEAFTALQAQVIPRLFAGKPAGGSVRVWVCGCSTGEEAYSVAILIQEHLERTRQAFKVQIFATDIDHQAIDQARNGVFPSSIAADISPERLAHYFTHEPGDGGYRIQKFIRDLIVFSEQDMIKDPPFSKLDLISCRNLLIYLNGDLQKKLIPLFHYALKPGGTLFLGTSETVGDFTTLFASLDRKWKIYQRLETGLGTLHPSLSEFVPPLLENAARAQPRPDAARGEGKVNWRDLIGQALLQHYAPASVLINGRGEVLHFYGRTGKYLEPAPGDAGMNVLQMAREGLRHELAMALHKVVAHREPVRYTGVAVKTNGDFTTINLIVRPVMANGSGEFLSDVFLVILEETPPMVDLAEPATSAQTGVPSPEMEARVIRLEQELRTKDEYLQATLEEMETSNEELKSTNEEMQSVNEELQSTNEELETSKEELQSVNEELSTVNAELQTKVVDLTRANNDMNNLLAGTGIGTLFVDHQLRISRFTPATTQLINLIQTDIGRPVGHIVSNLVGYNALVQDVQTVLDTLVPKEAEVQTKSNAWYLMRIRPYRTMENVIEGVVITFVDMTERKHAELALRQSDASFTKTFQAAPAALSVIQVATGRYTHVNDKFLALFGYAREQVLGKTVGEVGLHATPDANAARLLREHDGVREFETTMRTQSGKILQVLNSAVEIELAGEPHILTFTLDTTAR